MKTHDLVHFVQLLSFLSFILGQKAWINDYLHINVLRRDLDQSMWFFLLLFHMNFILYKEKKPSVLNQLDHLSSFMSNVFQDGLHYAFQL